MKMNHLDLSAIIKLETKGDDTYDDDDNVFFVRYLFEELPLEDSNDGEDMEGQGEEMVNDTYLLMFCYYRYKILPTSGSPPFPSLC